MNTRWIVPLLAVVPLAALPGAQDSHKPDPKAVAVKVAEVRVNMNKADLEYAVVDHTYWTGEHARMQKLMHNRAVSEAEYRDIRHKFERARADVGRAKHRLAEAEGLLEYARATGNIDLSPSARAVP